MDERLRELERLAETDPQARTGLLRAQVRAGILDAERVWLAGWLGDEAARAASDVELPEREQLWTERLPAWGGTVVAWSGLALARLWETPTEALTAWCQAPSALATKALKKAAKGGGEALQAACDQVVTAAVDGKLNRGVFRLNNELLDASEMPAFAERLAAIALDPSFVLPPCLWRRVAVARTLTDPEREARVLRWRVQEGELTEDALKLAASLGDAPAERALGPAAPDLIAPISGLLSLPTDVQRAAARAIAHALLERYQLKQGPIEGVAEALAGDDWKAASQAVSGALRAIKKRPPKELKALGQACAWAASQGPYKQAAAFVRVAEKSFATQVDQRWLVWSAVVPHLFGGLDTEPSEEDLARLEDPAAAPPATAKQVRYIRSLIRRIGVTGEELAELGAEGEEAVETLSRTEAGRMIGALLSLLDVQG